MTDLATTPAAGSLVLSLFPGVDLLGRAFAAEGYCVVRGPDLILGERVEDWHGVPGRVDGVIGGPPCQHYSDANTRRDEREGDRLVLEFLRVVAECAPEWFLLENVRNVPSVAVRGYTVQRLDITDAETGGPSRRLRHIQFGHRAGWVIRPARCDRARSHAPRPAVTASDGGGIDSHAERCRAMGFGVIDLPGFTPAARRRAVGNGVPLGMGLALARAVTRAGPVTDADCVCGCGRPRPPGRSHAGDACRQRCSRRARGWGRVLAWPAEVQRDRPGEDQDDRA